MDTGKNREMKFPHFEGVVQTEADWFEVLMRLARYLRGPQGCPWDREQGTGDFARFAGEEVQELVEALDSGDNAHAAEEFGDALFTLLAAAVAAEEEGRFQLGAALGQIHEKMIRRHAHVFGEEKAESAEDAVHVWNKVKAREKEPDT